MNCGEQIFYNKTTKRFYIKHENGVDCIQLDLSALRGRDGVNGKNGINGSGGNGFDIWPIDGFGGGFNPEGPFAISFNSPFAIQMETVEAQSQYRYIGSKALTARNLILQISSNTLDVDAIITIRKNSADTPLVLTVPAGSLDGTIIQNIIDTFVINTNDLISVELDITGATAGSISLRYLTFQVDYSA